MSRAAASKQWACRRAASASSAVGRTMSADRVGVLREDHGQVAAVQRGHRDPAAGQLGPGPRAVHPRHVGEPAGAALRGRAGVAGEPAGAAGGRDHQVGIDGLPVHDHAAEAAVADDRAVGVPGAQRQPRLAAGRGPDGPFERRAAALQPGHLRRQTRRAGRNAPGSQQRVPYLRQGAVERLAHDRPEEVGQQELHHPPPGPPAGRGRARVPVHHDHLVPPPGQRHRAEYPDRPATHHHCAHLRSPSRCYSGTVMPPSITSLHL